MVFRISSGVFAQLGIFIFSAMSFEKETTAGNFHLAGWEDVACLIGGAGGTWACLYVTW